jgi:hypothetical protein
MGALLDQTSRCADINRHGGSGCLDLGAPTDAVRSRHQAAGQALSRAIYRAHEDVDGFACTHRGWREEIVLRSLTEPSQSSTHLKRDGWRTIRSCRMCSRDTGRIFKCDSRTKPSAQSVGQLLDR